MIDELKTAGGLARLAVSVAVLVSAAGAFISAASWLSPTHQLRSYSLVVEIKWPGSEATTV